MKRIIRTYTELQRLRSFEDRFEYLNLTGKVGADIWGAERYLNQSFYRSAEWIAARRNVIARDLGLDLGIDEYPIFGSIYVHHMTPIIIDDLSGNCKYLLDPNYLISTSLKTHNAIHYGELPHLEPIRRAVDDHILWNRRSQRG